MSLGARGRMLLLAGLLLGAGGCEGYVKRGSTLYMERRYVEAAEVFERTEDRLAESSPRERAEYGLFRGLTLLALGDVRHAERWLNYAGGVERSHPGALRTDLRVELDRGWYALRQQLNAPPWPGIEPPQNAIAASPLPQGPPAPAPAPAPSPAGSASERRSFLPE